jgi:hypothetical protein
VGRNLDEGYKGVRNIQVFGLTKHFFGIKENVRLKLKADGKYRVKKTKNLQDEITQISNMLIKLQVNKSQ